MVREGVGEDTLRVALGHIPDTALPGTQGNVSIAGHRDTLFRKLRGVRKNDEIVVETLRGKYVYRVEGTQVVSPQDVSVLDPKPSHDLTLVTCYPFYYVGSAPDRFVVSARQVREIAQAELH
jgi:sortase A